MLLPVSETRVWALPDRARRGTGDIGCGGGIAARARSHRESVHSDRAGHGPNVPAALVGAVALMVPVHAAPVPPASLHAEAGADLKVGLAPVTVG